MTGRQEAKDEETRRRHGTESRLCHSWPQQPWQLNSAGHLALLAPHTCWISSLHTYKSSLTTSVGSSGSSRAAARPTASRSAPALQPSKRRAQRHSIGGKFFRQLLGRSREGRPQGCFDPRPHIHISHMHNLLAPGKQVLHSLSRPGLPPSTLCPTTPTATPLPPPLPAIAPHGPMRAGTPSASAPVCPCP